LSLDLEKLELQFMASIATIELENIAGLALSDREAQSD